MLGPKGLSFHAASVATASASVLLSLVMSAAPAHAAVAKAPDLVVTSVTAAPTTPTPGAPTRFTAVVKNQGTLATKAGVVLGVAFTVDGSSVTWSDTRNTSLAAGASATLTANGGTGGASTWTATTGTHAVEAYVDNINRIPGELSETNNKLTKSITVAEPARPDLVVTAVTTTPATPVAGEAVRFSATVRNQGTGSTPAGTVLGVTFSANGGPTSWSDTNTAALAPGASVTLTANGGTGGASTWTAVAGSNTVMANVDDANRIAGEVSETNNTMSQTFSVAEPVRPDLVVTAVSPAPGEPTSGEAVRFNATVKNQGTGSTPAGTVLGVTFSANGGPTSWSDTNTAALAPGASVTLTANGGTGGSSTWTAVAGINTVVASVDDTNRIAGEVSETNNTMSQTFSVTAPPAGPDKGESDTATAEARVANDPNTLWMGTFDDTTDWKTNWGFTSGNQRYTSTGTQSFSDTGKVLRVDASGNNDGYTGFGVDARPSFEDMGMANQDEAYFRYRVYIPANFNFYVGGKLPGLSGISPGEGDYTTSSGGIYRPSSWSGRTMWVSNGRMKSYLYAGYANGTNIQDNKSDANGHIYGIMREWYHNNVASQGVQLIQRGQWNTVELHYKMNTPGQNNGVFEGWLNGELGIRLADVSYRNTANAKLNINQLFFASFFGGPTANKTDQTWFFDDLVISKSPIGVRQ